MRLALSAVLAASSMLGVLGSLVACSSDDEPPPAADAGSDAAPVVPQPTSEAGVVGDGGGGTGKCEPQPLEQFPVTHAPPGPKHPGKCTSAQITALVDGCLGAGSTAEACEKAEKDAPACNTCMFGTVATSPATPIIVFPGYGTLIDRHLAGCVGLLTGENDEGSCTVQVAAAVQCKLAACPPTACPIATTADLPAFNECTRAAAASDKHCKPTEDGANACIGALPPAIRDACFEPLANGVVPVIKKYAELFCGSAPDGG